METTTHPTEAIEIVIPEAHREAATRYIVAIIGRDPLALVGDTHVESRTHELWARFETDYRSLHQGPYARRGADALRIALEKL
jgi:hypothetical protein